MKGCRFDALTIILINAVLPVMCSAFPSDKMVALSYLVAVGILLAAGKLKRILKVGIIIAIFLGVYFLNERYINHQFFGAWLRIMLLFMPSVALATILISEYQSSEVLSALQRARLPRLFVIGLTVTLRYIPTFYREFSIIKKAMRIRGVEFSVCHPLRSFEYMMVPQLFRCVSLSNELTAAGLTKGISFSGRRSAYFNQGFRMIDYVTGLLLIAAYGAVISGVV